MGILPRHQIFTHRGLEPSQSDFFPESSFEAFESHLSRGFGIEFDPTFLADGTIAILHDATLSRITNGQDTRTVASLTQKELLSIPLKRGRICLFDELMELISRTPSSINALHLKGKFQTDQYLSALLGKLSEYPNLIPRLLIFDVKPDVARFLKKKNSDFVLAPSVAHPYDIERYNDVASGTLISVPDAVTYKKEGLYDWVWLDEWDKKASENGGDKTLYNRDTFAVLKNAGYTIALVTPELHATSPGLLGGESHPDAKNNTTLFGRISEIIALGPDALCTDYPEEVLTL